LADACTGCITKPGGASICLGQAAADQGPEGFGVAKQACEAGNQDGCALLADKYADGIGVAKDPAQAQTLRGQACDKGVAASCTRLGLYEKGCKAGDTDACDVLCKRGNAAACQNASEDAKNARRRAVVGDPGSAEGVVQELGETADTIAKVIAFARALEADTSIPSARKLPTLMRMREKLPQIRAMYCAQKNQKPRTYTPAQWTAAVTYRCEDNPPEQFYPNVFPNPNPPLNTVADCKAAYATPCR
jgi:hypothetical protein